jgi:hypothetical protein
MLVAQAVLLMAALYLLGGLIFGLVFVTYGVGRFDPAARSTSPAFRLLILPGAVALWPFLLGRWLGFVRSGAVRSGGNNP